MVRGVRAINVQLGDRDRGAKWTAVTRQTTMAHVPAWTIKPEPTTRADIDEVIWQYFTEAAQRVLGSPATETQLRKALDADPHSDLIPPRGVFLVARDGDDKLLGCTGIRLLSDPAATAELKRMYVRPVSRGLGLGRALLLAAEDSARELGARQIILETKAELVEARTLYSAHGYREATSYNNPGDAARWYMKPLTDSP
jgi:GNAT superfamily N-acetyltransferase